MKQMKQIKQLKQRLLFELRCILDKRIITLPILLLSALIGVLTWLCCHRLSLWWELCRYIRLALPYPVMFVLWCLSVLCFSLLIAAAFTFCGIGRCTLSVALSYILYLFWLPLNFPGMAPAAAGCTLVLSLTFFAAAVKFTRGRVSFISSLGIFLSMWIIYCLIFTAAYHLI